MEVRKINGDKLPTGMYVAKYSTKDLESNDQNVITKGSFFKTPKTDFGINGLHSGELKESTNLYHNEKKGIFYINRNLVQLPHQINIGSQAYAHPNHIMVPNKGVTLIMNNGAVKKTHSQQPAVQQIKQYKSITNPHRMSRAQYAATIAVN